MDNKYFALAYKLRPEGFIFLIEQINPRTYSTMRRKSNQKANSLRANRGNSRNKNNGSYHDLPQRNLTIKNSKVFRFAVKSTIDSVPITPFSIRGIFGLIAVTSTQLQPFVKSFRVKRVTIHSPPVTFGSYATSTIKWIGTYGEHIVVSDTSINTARPVFVTSAPPKESLASFWRICSDNDPFMLVSASQNSIIDFEVEWVQYEGDNALAYFVASAPVPTASVLYGYLDGITTTIRPIGIATYS